MPTDTSTIPRPASPSSLGDTIELLGQLLGESIAQLFGAEFLERAEKIRVRCRDARDEADLHQIAREFRSYSVDELKRLLHCFSIFFLLRNQAEQCEIIRIKRDREQRETINSPRTESIAEALQTLVNRGIDTATLKQILTEIQVIPTITAHPTESRRRSILLKQLTIASLLFEISLPTIGEMRRLVILDDLRATITGLLVTDDVRAKRLSVHDEVENGIFFLAGSILDVVPRIMGDIAHAMSSVGVSEFDPPPLLRYRSWIGGDRDGNPQVTAAVTKDALLLHRSAILKHFHQILREVRNELSVSTRKASFPEALSDSLLSDKRLLGIAHDALVDDHQLFEPLREKCELMILKISGALTESIEYGEGDFRADLALLKDSLRVAGLDPLARRGTLQKVIYQANVFGFSLADLDLRQHSKVHQAALTEILASLGLCEDYSTLTEPQKVALLHELLRRPDSFAPDSLALGTVSAETVEVLAVFRLVKEWQQRKRSGLSCYIISMTHTVSDMLEPLLLWRFAAGPEPLPLDLVPLFETIEDLDGSRLLLSSIISDPLYRLHLRSRGDFQEVMLGYSDSNKDGGYVSASVLLYEAQLQISQLCRAEGITFQIFHGRGGSVGRGGGRAGRAILASPPESHSGKLRFTEQGEVISFRYSMPELAHRHLEQIVSAVILSVGAPTPSLSSAELAELKGLAETARLKYRSLIDAPGFWEWYVGTTPINFISTLPIASRPVMRAGANLEFENLRAIPWVFSWTQKRYNVPSWFGLGTALEDLFSRDPSARERYRTLYREKIFFRSLIDNAQQEMARARLVIAKHYDWGEGESFHPVIAEEYQRTERALLAITEQAELLDNNRVIKRSIAYRNPYTDALNLIQVELLARARECKEPAMQSELREAIHMSISGLAAAMQTTG